VSQPAESHGSSSEIVDEMGAIGGEVLQFIGFVIVVVLCLYGCRAVELENMRERERREEEHVAALAKVIEWSIEQQCREQRAEEKAVREAGKAAAEQTP